MITDKMLEENTTPWGLLSEEMKDALKACNLKELEVYTGVTGWSEASTYPSVVTPHTATLRKKPTPLTKPDIPWGAIKDEFKWAARDESGAVWVYGGKPVVCEDDGYWTLKSLGGVSILNEAIRVDPGACDWKDSLVHRLD